MRKNGKVGRMLCLLVLVCMMLFSACSSKTGFDMEDFEEVKDTVQLTYAFSSQDTSEQVSYNAEALAKFREDLSTDYAVYGYEELFDYEQAIGGIKSGLRVEKHASHGLEAVGTLTEQQLFDVVRQNNTAYLSSLGTTIVRDVEDALLHRICQIVVETVTDILNQYPDIDKGRVYCNLGNLKVVEKGSALDLAAVEPGMVMHVNSSTSKMASITSDSNMYNVLVHETMHIIQYGCLCEQVEGCIRRVGLAYAYENVEQDYSDWTWLVEGSAEQMTSLYCNVEVMTYKNYVNYVQSLDMATVLRSDIPVHYVETISFYNDLDRLFDVFGAETEEQKQEIYKMMYSLEIMQVMPQDVQDAYQRLYGEEWNDQVRDYFNYTQKRSIVQTFTKVFYQNLAQALTENTVTKNDLLLLLNLYESTINYHLTLDNPGSDEYNAPFVQWYTGVQQAFFDCLENVTPADYQTYIAHDGVSVIHAGMKWLPKDKQAFLISKLEDHLCDYKFLPSVA